MLEPAIFTFEHHLLFDGNVITFACHKSCPPEHAAELLLRMHNLPGRCWLPEKFLTANFGELAFTEKNSLPSDTVYQYELELNNCLTASKVEDVYSDERKLIPFFKDHYIQFINLYCEEEQFFELSKEMRKRTNITYMSRLEFDKKLKRLYLDFVKYGSP